MRRILLIAESIIIGQRVSSHAQLLETDKSQGLQLLVLTVSHAGPFLTRCSTLRSAAGRSYSGTATDAYEAQPTAPTRIDVH